MCGDLKKTAIEREAPLSKGRLGMYLCTYMQWRIQGGGVRGFNLPPPECVFACQYMKIPADLDPNPPPLEDFLDPPLTCVYSYMVVGGFVHACSLSQAGGRKSFLVT